MADPLTAHARLRIGEPRRAIAALGAHFSGHAVLAETPRGAVLEAPRFGRLTLSADGPYLLAECESPNASALAFLKMYTAEGLCQKLGAAATGLRWSGDGGGTLPFFREMRVVRTEAVTPLVRRVVLAGDAAHFAASGGLHVRVLIPPAGRHPVWPVAGADGRMVWPKGEDALVPRVYTVRHVWPERSEIAIDVVLHAGASTPGADWARGARAGEMVGLLGPGGAAPEPAAWMLLAGDETALPAITRVLETLPRETQAVVRIEVQDQAEIQPLSSPAGLDLRYLLRGPAQPGCAGLLETAVRDITLPSHPAHIRAFAACEQAEARRIRGRLAAAGLGKDRSLVAAYWRRGHAGVDIGE